MQVQVRLGAGLARVAGTPRMIVELADGATVADLLDCLESSYPTLAAGLPAALPLVAGEHAARAQELAHGDEVALLLPAAGG